MLNMQLGEVIFGGVGAGLYGMLVMVVLTVFSRASWSGAHPSISAKPFRRARSR